MNRKVWIAILSALWLVTLGGAFMLGRSHARGWGKAAQVECLRQMWGQSPFTFEQLQQFRAFEHDPETIRALLLKWIQDNNHQVAQMNEVFKAQGSAWADVPDSDQLRRMRARNLLVSWKPGQTTFMEPTPEQLKKESWK